MFPVENFFDSSRESYNALTNWLTDVRTLASPNIVIILCGNKKDLEDQRQVTFIEASQFAQEHGKQIFVEKFEMIKTEFLDLFFLETSAFANENISDSFEQCARGILNKIETGSIDPLRMYSGIQMNRAIIAAASQNDDSSNNLIRRSTRNCALCQT